MDPFKSCTGDTKRLPDTQSGEHTGSICKMGMIRMNVNDYMSSLHTYLETPSASRWDGNIKSVSNFPKSIPELLRLCEADPVDLLFDLGFGIDEPDLCTKIPSRFIMSPSEAKGINIRVFLEAQKKRMDMENPNLCGRFRQLEVLEQVTSAFSSLLNDVHSIHSGNGEIKGNTGKKSNLTQEKRKIICQLLWKYAREAKMRDQNSDKNPSKDGELENEGDENQVPPANGSTKVFRKTRRRIPEFGSVAVSTKTDMPTGDKIDVLSKKQQTQNNPNQVSSVHTPVKQYNLITKVSTKSATFKGPKILPKKFRRSSGQHSLQPPDSFELEEVQSFEEESPRGVFSNSLTDVQMRRTNSCQSDSSGFQEEPTEPLLLQSLHESLNLSSDSIDSQATLTGKNVSSPFQEDYTEETKTANHPAEYGECIKSSFDSIAHANKEIAKLSTMDTNTSEEVFQSFEKQADGFNNNTNQEEYEEELKQNNDQNEIASNNGEFVNDASMLQECEQEEQVDMDASETKFPVYRMHYLSRTIASHNNDESSVVHKNTVQDNLGCCVSELKKKNNIDYNQLSETDCCLQSSINLPEVTYTPPPINELLSSAILGPDNYVQYLADEIEFCQKSKKSTFQTEVNTNIYKSVTIQMSSQLMSDLPSTNTSECLNRQYSFYTTKADRNEHCMLNLNTQKKEALRQTGIRTWGHSCTSNHCMLHRNCFPTESLSFDRGVYDLHHHHHHNHQALRCSCNHCCHSCHRHHCCCSRFPSVYKHNGTMIEKELTDTLKLLKESLTNVSMHTDHDLEHMKNSCRVFKDKLIEIEHVLNKQQAGCWTTLSSEGWEEVRRLHLLRRSVLKEVSELELRLDEREWHVKEALSKQLDQVLEEQSRLYSELDLSDWESENKLYDRDDKPLQMKSFTASAPASYEDISQDAHTNVTMENETKGLTLPQKMDFSAILQNIKKTFKRF